MPKHSGCVFLQVFSGKVVRFASKWVPFDRLMATHLKFSNEVVNHVAEMVFIQHVAVFRDPSLKLHSVQPSDTLTTVSVYTLTSAWPLQLNPTIYFTFVLLRGVCTFTYSDVRRKYQKCRTKIKRRGVTKEPRYWRKSSRAFRNLWAFVWLLFICRNTTNSALFQLELTFSSFLPACQTRYAERICIVFVV